MACAQADITLRVTQAGLRTRLGTGTEQDAADAGISRRLSGEGFFAADGDMHSKKRFTFTKAAALAK